MGKEYLITGRMGMKGSPASLKPAESHHITSSKEKLSFTC